MKQKLHYLLVVLSIAFVTKSYSQKGNYHITNGISVNGGITKYDIITDNFETEQITGYLGGFLATVDIPHRWYNMSFGMQLSENHIGILGRPTQISAESDFVEYKLFTVQVALLGHIKLIKRYFTIDVGPMLQYNGSLDLNDKKQETYYINNYDNLLASDVSNISKFNINGAIGASAGLDFISLKVQYIYGFTNILKKLNTENLDTAGNNEKSFKGNQSMLVLGVIISF